MKICHTSLADPINLPKELRPIGGIGNDVANPHRHVVSAGPELALAPLIPTLLTLLGQHPANREKSSVVKESPIVDRKRFDAASK
jgi:hypothetical protein